MKTIEEYMRLPYKLEIVRDTEEGLNREQEALPGLTEQHTRAAEEEGEILRELLSLFMQKIELLCNWIFFGQFSVVVSICCYRHVTQVLTNKLPSHLRVACSLLKFTHK